SETTVVRTRSIRSNARKPKKLALKQTMKSTEWSRIDCKEPTQRVTAKAASVMRRSSIGWIILTSMRNGTRDAGHAYLVRGGEEMLPVLSAHLAKEGVVFAGNPDVYVRTY